MSPTSLSDTAGRLPFLWGQFRYGTAFGVLLVASAVFRLSYTPLVPLTGDELMHWQWGRHLAMGYPEHPPLIAWLIALFSSVLGTSQLVVRLPSVIAVTCTFYFAFRLARELFSDRAAFFGVVPLMLTPLYNAGGTLANTDGLLSCFWTLSMYSMKKAVIDDWRPGWLCVGLATGFGLLSKLPSVFLFPAGLLFLALTPEGRPWLRRWEPYAAAVLAWVMFLPPLIWNAQHDWFTIAMRTGHQVAGRFTLAYFAELMGAQLGLVSPFLFIWAVWGVVRCWRGPSDPRAVLLAAYASVPFLAYSSYSLYARAAIHWPGVSYVAAFLAAGAWTAAAAHRRAGFRLSLAAVPAVLLTGLVYVAPLIPEQIARIPWSYGFRPEKVSHQMMKEIFDWGIVGREIQELLDRDPENSFVLAREGYGMAGLLAFYTPKHPDVFLWKLEKRNGVAYDMWRAEADLVGKNAVIVEDFDNPGWFERVRCCFDTVTEPQRVPIVFDGQVIREFHVAYGTNFSGFPPEAD